MSASNGGNKIIVVRKKKGGHGGHHGGSWKVAYADFVTAMMAFFLVMWIMGMDQGVKELVEGYFNNPVGFKRAFSGGSNPISAGNHPNNLDLRRNQIAVRELQRERFERAGHGISEKLQEAGFGGELAADVEIQVTEDGLRIELMETGEGDTFFDKSSATLKPLMNSVLQVIAPELAALPNLLVVEGHTDALPFGTEGYSNWELSVDRANAARRALIQYGMDEDRVVEVRGYADRHPKIADSPLDPRNRRISVLLPFTEEPVVEFLPISGLAGVSPVAGSGVGTSVGEGR